MSINKDSHKAPNLRFKGFTDDWEQRKLGDTLVELKSGLSRMLSNNDIGLPVIRANNIKNGMLDLETDIKYWYSNDPQGANTENYLVEKENILINFINSDAKMGTAAIVREAISRNTIYTTNILKAQTNSDFNPYFWFTLTQTLQYKNSIKMITKPAVNQSSFTTVDFKKLIFAFPKLSEQSKIGNFIKLIDNTITHHQRKLDQLNQLKEALLQKMFPGKGETVPKLRFVGFEGDWEERKLGDLLNKNTEKNKDLSVINVESVSNKTGFTKQTEQFGDYSVASADLSNYYVIRERQFAYNPSRINVGSIAYKALGDDTAVVSPLYVSFSTKSRLHDGFIWNWFKTPLFDAQRQRLAEGGVRDTLSFTQLSEMDIISPDYLEQEKISDVFKQLDNTITLQQRKLEQLKDMKQVLLQNMFI